MKTTRNVILVLTCLLASITVRSQGQWSYKSHEVNPRSHEHHLDFYVGLQLNSPMFWGDLRSFGEKNRLGIGSSFFAGYTINNWFSPEVVLEWGKGRLGAMKHQSDYYFNQEGLITYVKRNPTDKKLGEVYTKVNYVQAGMRFQIAVFKLLQPRRSHKFDLEVAPAAYWQKIYPRMYTVEGDHKLSNYGSTEANWDYAVGGDMGVRYNFEHTGSSIFVRASLLWLNNESFDGVDVDPFWRDNFQVNASVGVCFYLWKP